MLTLQQVKNELTRRVWHTDVDALPWPRRLLVRAARIGYVVLRDAGDGQLTLQAMSLVYTTLLSLVPLIAVSFSVLKAFGVHNQVEPVLLNFLEPLEEKGVEITERMIQFVDRIEVGVLGTVGLGLLIYTVVSLIQKIEQAFNYIWCVKVARRLSQRFSDYLSVIVIGPVLVVAALGFTASISSAHFVQYIVAMEPFHTLIAFAAKLVPYLLIIGAFTFVYIFVPNIKVRLRSALVGAIVAGILWESAGLAFTAFVVRSASYTAIYASFAILIMFMIWLYVSWLILLLGASIAFYHQHPEHVTSARRTTGHNMSSRTKERLALLILSLIGRDHYGSGSSWTAATLAHRLRLPVIAVQSLLASLERHGIVKQTADDPPLYLPAVALENISLWQVLDAVRSDQDVKAVSAGEEPERSVDQVVVELDKALSTALKGKTVKDLALGGGLEQTPRERLRK